MRIHSMSKNWEVQHVSSKIMLHNKTKKQIIDLHLQTEAFIIRMTNRLSLHNYYKLARCCAWENLNYKIYNR